MTESRGSACPALSGAEQEGQLESQVRDESQVPVARLGSPRSGAERQSLSGCLFARRKVCGVQALCEGQSRGETATALAEDDMGRADVERPDGRLDCHRCGERPHHWLRPTEPAAVRGRDDGWRRDRSRHHRRNMPDRRHHPRDSLAGHQRQQTPMPCMWATRKGAVRAVQEMWLRLPVRRALQALRTL